MRDGLELKSVNFAKIKNGLLFYSYLRSIAHCAAICIAVFKCKFAKPFLLHVLEAARYHMTHWAQSFSIGGSMSPKARVLSLQAR